MIISLIMLLSVYFSYLFLREVKEYDSVALTRPCS
jgi:hypothetical protein